MSTYVKTVNDTQTPQFGADFDGQTFDLTTTGDISAATITATTGFVGNITGAASTVTVADESSDTTCFPLFVTAATGDLAPKSGSNLTFDSSNGALAATLLQGDHIGGTLTTETGSGLTGIAAYSSQITKQGNVITTHIFLDIENLLASTTLNDIIGDDDAANAHAGQLLLADVGQVFDGTVTCLEVPTGAIADIDFNLSSVATGAEDADVTALSDPVVMLAAGGAWTLGQTQTITGYPDGTSDYLYLSVGLAGTPGTYTAGQFFIELKGYAA